MADIQFQLKTKGRDRGYVERKEVDTRGRLNVEVEPRISRDLDEQIKRILGVVATGSQPFVPPPFDAIPELAEYIVARNF